MFGNLVRLFWGFAQFCEYTHMYISHYRLALRQFRDLCFWADSGPEESRSPPSGSVNHDISLQQGSPPAPLFTGLACGGAVIAIAFIAALDRKPAPTVSRAQQRTTALEIVSCPICGEKTESYLLIRHLIVDHKVDSSEASEIAERASSEEE